MTYAWTPGQAQSKPDLASDDAAGTVTEMVNKVMEAIKADMGRQNPTPMDAHDWAARGDVKTIDLTSLAEVAITEMLLPTDEMLAAYVKAIDAGIHRHVKLTPMDCVIEAAKEAWPAFIKAALGRE